MRTLLNDLRYGLRMLARNPGFAAVAVIALALGIGANTAIFSVVNGVLLRPLPYRDPANLMRLSESAPDFGTMSVAYPNFRDWKDQNRSFQSLASIRWEDYDLTETGRPEHLSGKMISADFFRVLGIHPLLGRDFDPASDRLGAAPVALIGEELWNRRWSSNPAVVGTQLRLNGKSYMIAGIVPAGFQFEGKADVYTLVEQWDDILARSREMHPGMYVVGRLQPGVTQAQAQSEMSAIAARLAEAYPKSNSRHGINVKPLMSVIVGNVRPTLLVLLGAVGFVLLIACANVANLLLARFTGRRREIAIRAAIGAGRARVVRQLLTESAVLALTGGLAGLAIARWGTQAVLAAVPGGLPRSESIAVDVRVLAFTLAVSLVTGIVFGLVPALQVSATNVYEPLNEGIRGSSAGHRRLRDLLVVSEVAAALVLLAGAGLMLRTMRSLSGVHPGFDPDRVLTFSAGFSPANTSSGNRILQTFDQTIERLQKLPGVKAAAVSALIPLAGNDNELPFYVYGRPRPTSQGDMSWALLYIASSGYLKTMDIPLLRGRYLEPRDMRHGSHVVVIDEAMARSVFPNEDPLGKSIVVADLSGDLGPEAAVPMEIVGIVGHVTHWGLDSDAYARVRSQVYLPWSQVPDQFLKGTAASSVFLVRTAAEPLAALPAVRAAVLESGQDQPVYSVRTMDQIVSASIADRRFSMLLLGIFAALALLLAAVGIYGVISYTVAQRTREIGIRIALGAGQTDVLRIVVAQSMLPVVAGLAIGLAASLALTRLMAGMLYGVAAGDPVTLIAVALLLSAVALLATVIPARRAARVAPAIALRCD
ncbi:MAG TPA: ABC transporter permease [Candidatus Acidoferrales bacterium]|nr:ABC transporter permease [Candidatus Acidoferrales bacterium]